MELFLKYLKGRRRVFLTAAGCCFIFICSFLLYHLPLEALLYPALLCTAIGLVICAADYFRVKREHELLRQIRTMTAGFQYSALTAPFRQKEVLKAFLPK